MELKDFKGKKDLFVYTERHVNKGAYHSFRHYSEVSKSFRPRDGDPNFQLPFLEINNSQIEYLETTPSPSLLKFVKGSKTKFFFHPDMNDFYHKAGCQSLVLKKASGFVRAIPTASTRTLLIDIPKPFMVKVDLSGKRLGRLVRDLKGRSARHSHRVNLELDYLLEKKLLPQSMAYLPETIATCFVDGEVEVANIFREYLPRPLTDSHAFMIPFFSLYSPDDNDPLAPFIVEQLIQISGLEPIKFFEKKIVRPVLWNFFYMMFKFGIIFEAHPQNTLLELDENFHPQRIIYRDLQAVIIDKKTRSENGYDNEGFQENKIVGNRKPQTSRKIEYSTAYDHRVAYQTLEEIIIALANKYIISVDELRRVVQRVARETFKKLKVDPDDYFPKNSYYLLRDGNTKNNELIAGRHPDPPYR